MNVAPPPPRAEGGSGSAGGAHLTDVLLHGGGASSVADDLPGRQERVLAQQELVLQGGEAVVQAGLLTLTKTPAAGQDPRSPGGKTLVDRQTDKCRLSHDLLHWWR